MDESKEYHTKWSKSGTDRQISYNLYVESKKKDTNRHVYKNKWTPKHRKQTYSY